MLISKCVGRGIGIAVVLMVMSLGCGSGSGTGSSSGSGGSTSDGPTSSVVSSSATSAVSSGGMPRCDSSNCAGCCFDNVCQPGNTAAACGKNGLACEACMAGDICKVDQTCGIDPESMWQVRPVSGTVSATNGGASWDFGGGAPDPFVALYCPASAVAATITTTAAADTFTPMWNTPGCIMSAHDLMTVGVGVEVWDEDGAVNDIISAKGALVVTEAMLHAGGLTAGNGTTLPSLTIALTQK